MPVLALVLVALKKGKKKNLGKIAGFILHTTFSEFPTRWAGSLSPKARMKKGGILGVALLPPPFQSRRHNSDGKGCQACK